jgi:hypothetical protein
MKIFLYLDQNLKSICAQVLTKVLLVLTRTVKLIACGQYRDAVTMKPFCFGRPTHIAGMVLCWQYRHKYPDLTYCLPTKTHASPKQTATNLTAGPL